MKNFKVKDLQVMITPFYVNEKHILKHRICKNSIKYTGSSKEDLMKSFSISSEFLLNPS